jgi:glycerophosphoryl diester phosphodiesterase
MHPLAIPKVIGHRGACRYAPENTLASLRKAAELGARWVEFDAMLTLDAVVIVMHDETLDRTTNGHGLVAETPYEEIAKLDAGIWFAPEYQGEKVPTMVEFLTEAKRLGLGVNIEIKPTPGKDIETAFAVVQLLQMHGFNQRMHILITSFSSESLAIVHALESNFRIGLLLDHWIIAWHDILEQLNCISLHANYKMLNQKNVAEVKNMGKLVLAYTVNDLEKAKQLYGWGVDSVFSESLLLDVENASV